MTTTIRHHPDVASLLALSDERDQWMRCQLAAWREAYRLGRLDGIEEGRALEAAERDGFWRNLGRRLAAQPSFAELERRRWGPGGRERFGELQPGDYPGREVA